MSDRFDVICAIVCDITVNIHTRTSPVEQFLSFVAGMTASGLLACGNGRTDCFASATGEIVTLTRHENHGSY